MISDESFRTKSLTSHLLGDAILRILAAAVHSVEPGEVIRRAVHKEEDTLVIRGNRIKLSSFRHIYLLGLGKASYAMTRTLAGILGDPLTAALAISKHSSHQLSDPETNHRLTEIVGGHPIPDERSLRAGDEVLKFLSFLGPNDLLICLISGGGSALVTAPVGGVTLANIQELTAKMLSCGANIREINCIRRRLDRLKGGGVVRLVPGTKVISLILSDVVGNPLEAIASGPTVEDPVKPGVIKSILDTYQLAGKIPESILTALEVDEERRNTGVQFGLVENILVGSNLTAAQGALKQAEQEGFNPHLLRTNLEGEAREAGFILSTFLRQAKKTGDPVAPPACIIAGGETTVTIHGKGKGGRNTELALAAVSELADFPGVTLVTLATDGEDGPTDAAGAVVTGETYRRARLLGMDPGDYLENNDSYTFFERLGDLLKPGPTGTNVNDLTFLFT